MICRHGPHWKVRPCSFIGSLQTRQRGVIRQRERPRPPAVSTALIEVTCRPATRKSPLSGGNGESGESCEEPRRLWRRGIIILTADFDREISITVEYLFGLDRETDRNLGATVENLKDMTTKQTVELATDSLLGNQFDTAITSVTRGTSEVRLSHVRNHTIFSVHCTFIERRPGYVPPVGHAPGLAGRLDAFDPTG